jgi:hypothetical protein
MNKDYSNYSTPELTTSEKLKQTKEQLEINIILLNKVSSLESKGLKAFKTSYSLTNNLKNMDIIILNSNDGLYYRIDAIKLLTDSKNPISGDITEQYLELLSYIDLDFIIKHNNNMLNSNIIDFKEIPLLNLEEVEK